MSRAVPVTANSHESSTRSPWGTSRRERTAYVCLRPADSTTRRAPRPTSRSSANGPSPWVRESTCAATRTDPNGSPSRAPPRHHPATATSSGTSSRPETVVPTLRTVTLRPPGSTIARGGSARTTVGARRAGATGVRAPVADDGSPERAVVGLGTVADEGGGPCCCGGDSAQPTAVASTVAATPAPSAATGLIPPDCPRRHAGVRSLPRRPGNRPGRAAAVGPGRPRRTP